MSLLRRFSPTQIVLVGSIPVLGYALAYAYERGYTGRYGVPAWMTRVTLTQALIASIVAAVLVAATPYLARALARFTSRSLVGVVLAPAAGLAVALWAASETQWVMGRHLAIPVALITVFGGFAALRLYRSVIVPLMRPGEGSWIDRVKGSAMRGDATGFGALAWMGQRVRWTLAVIVVALVGAHWYGNYHSRNERRFLISSSSPTCVAVRRNPDGIICAITDLTRRRVLPEIRVLPLSDPRQKLTVATLSPLRSPLDADRKLFARRRTTGTTGTVYAARREDAPATQAGRPRTTTPVKKAAATPVKKAPASKATAKKKTTTTKKSTATKRTNRDRR